MCNTTSGHSAVRSKELRLFKRNRRDRSEYKKVANEIITVTFFCFFRSSSTTLHTASTHNHSGVKPFCFWPRTPMSLSALSTGRSNQIIELNSDSVGSGGYGKIYYVALLYNYLCERGETLLFLSVTDFGSTAEPRSKVGYKCV